jgi:hypothetical protein
MPNEKGLRLGKTREAPAAGAERLRGRLNRPAWGVRYAWFSCDRESGDLIRSMAGPPFARLRGSFLTLRLYSVDACTSS